MSTTSIEKEIVGHFIQWSEELEEASVVLYYKDGFTQSVDASHQNFAKIIAKVKQKDYEGIEELVHPVDIMKDFVSKTQSTNKASSTNGVTFDGQSIFYKGKPMDHVMETYIVLMYKNGHDIQHLLNFLDRAMQNPSKRSKDQLWGFLAYGQNMINPDGTFKAYKVVNDDYTDCHTRTFDNSPGKVLSMERNDVDDDPDRTCSYGFHVFSREYTRSFYSRSRRVVEVHVDPADVVSVPRDYNNTKMRVCRYTVVQDITDSYDSGEDNLQYDKENEEDKNQSIERLIERNLEALKDLVFDALEDEVSDSDLYPDSYVCDWDYDDGEWR